MVTVMLLNCSLFDSDCDDGVSAGIWVIHRGAILVPFQGSVAHLEIIVVAIKYAINVKGFDIQRLDLQGARRIVEPIPNKHL